jgi:hypothetical protein
MRESLFRLLLNYFRNCSEIIRLTIGGVSRLFLNLKFRCKSVENRGIELDRTDDLLITKVEYLEKIGVGIWL